jgi:hypothetical protein
MTSCEQCGHDLAGDRFCTQCGARAASPRPAPAAPAAPARSLSRTAPRFPLFAEERHEATTVRGARQPSLAETAVRTGAGPALAEREPELEAEVESAFRFGAAGVEPVARRSGADRTWLTSFGILTGVLVAMLVVGVLLLLH